ncbi:hypothetical protein HK101_006911 [Irineochytrium annulatum]|nr:hypothetical protein HK101_006911 [Irineochytrium annulatum]
MTMYPFGTCIAVGALNLWSLTFAGSISPTSVESLVQVWVLVATYVLTDYGRATGLASVLGASNFLWALQTCILTHLELDRLERFVLRTPVTRYLVRAFAIVVCGAQIVFPVYAVASGDPGVLSAATGTTMTVASFATCAFDILCDVLVIGHVLQGKKSDKWKIVTKQACALIIYVATLCFCAVWEYTVDVESGLQLWATVDVAAVFSYMCMYRVLLDVVTSEKASTKDSVPYSTGTDRLYIKSLETQLSWGGRNLQNLASPAILPSMMSLGIRDPRSRTGPGGLAGNEAEDRSDFMFPPDSTTPATAAALMVPEPRQNPRHSNLHPASAFPTITTTTTSSQAFLAASGMTPPQHPISDSYRRAVHLLGSLSRSLGRNNPLAMSIGKNSLGRSGASFLETFLGPRSPFMLASPSRDLAQFAMLEDQFCKDFVCCGNDLENLHDLLQHFEECHVRVESDFDEDDDEHMDFMEDDDMDMEGVPNSYQQNHLKDAFGAKDRAGAGMKVFPTANPHAVSAFDTSIIRRRKPNDLLLHTTHPHLVGPQRSNSVSSSDPASRQRSYPQQLQLRHSTHDEDPLTPAATLPFTVDGPPTVVMADIDTDMDDADDADEDETDHPFPEGHMQNIQQMHQMHLPLLDRRPALARTGSAPPFLPSAVGTVEPARLHSRASTPIGSRCASPSSDSGVSVHTVTGAPGAPLPIIPKAAAAPRPRVMAVATDHDSPRKYRCMVEGCEKTYKNPGGLKYHSIHGHAEDTGDPELNMVMQRPYQCTVVECGKRYKNLNGLKEHSCLAIDFTE